MPSATPIAPPLTGPRATAGDALAPAAHHTAGVPDRRLKTLEIRKRELRAAAGRPADPEDPRLPAESLRVAAERLLAARQKLAACLRGDGLSRGRP